VKPPESQPGVGVVHRASGDPGRVRHLGPYGIESLIDPEEEGRATAYRVTIGPHQTTRVSVHRVAEEFYFVIAGRGTAILDGVEHALKAGDFLRLPPGTSHGFRTDDDPLDMLNTHTPGCRPDRDVHFPDGPAPAGFGPKDGRG
jgi:mannose-6-phosphate isomerase-like protein (cupin superfamily)